MTRKILVVDDEPDIRELARMSFELVGGYIVTVAESGAHALELMAAERPDAVVMDVQMPNLDGPATLDALRRNPPDGGPPPVVFLTASVLESELAALRTLPVAGVLAKPFDPMTLPAALATLLGWQP